MQLGSTIYTARPLAGAATPGGSGFGAAGLQALPRCARCLCGLHLCLSRFKCRQNTEQACMHVTLWALATSEMRTLLMLLALLQVSPAHRASLHPCESLLMAPFVTKQGSQRSELVWSVVQNMRTCYLKF